MKSFNEIYENVYKEAKDVLETARKEALMRNITVFIIIFVVVIALTFIAQNGFFIIGGFVVFTLYYISSSKNRKYTNLFKNNVIGKFVKEYNENLTYNPNRGVYPRSYREGEFEQFNRFYSEDAISGTLGEGSIINMAEVKTQEEHRDSDGDTTRTTLFHGLFAEVRFQKLVNAKIKVRKDKMLFEGKDRIEMDSGEFEKSFSVFSTDSIIAMQLFTADIMQMMLDFKENNKITPELTIKNDKMYIRFNTGNVFEANMLQDALEFDTLLKYYNIITFTLGLTEKIVKNIKETEL